MVTRNRSSELSMRTGSRVSFLSVAPMRRYPVPSSRSTVPPSGYGVDRSSENRNALRVDVDASWVSRCLETAPSMVPENISGVHSVLLVSAAFLDRSMSRKIK